MSHFGIPRFSLGCRGGWDDEAREAGRCEGAVGRTSGISSKPGTSGIPFAVTQFGFIPQRGLPILLFSLLCFSLQVEFGAG